ncbi:MAG: diaminopimelate epimerase [Candidatus Bostrichicola ureolyticus]|nr:MAG: diaminopimelate epimerase [Candidatus Bostrichicola ureolyticus]
MKLKFFKYQGTGNDFILIDARNLKFDFNVKLLCNRKFGIGADGLILIKNDKNSQFYMKYYNSDGKESTMCGNGGRCAVAFSKYLGIINNNKAYFRALDGNHIAYIKNNFISLKMIDVTSIKINTNHVFLNTGSPHHIIFIKNINNINVYSLGKEIRFKEPYKKNGVNVNFVEVFKNFLKVRTYERGVENETLSCGTGAVASAIAAFELGKIVNNKILIHTLGGKIFVKFFKYKDYSYKRIWIKGPYKFIYYGYIDTDSLKYELNSF